MFFLSQTKVEDGYSGVTFQFYVEEDLRMRSSVGDPALYLKL